MKNNPLKWAGPALPDQPETCMLKRTEEKGSRGKKKTSQRTNIKSSINPEPWGKTRRNRNPAGETKEMNKQEEAKPVKILQTGRNE